MTTVYSNNFSWKKSQGPGTLVAKLEMGSFQAVKKVILLYAGKCWQPLNLGKLIVKVLQNKNEIYGSQASVDPITQTLLNFSSVMWRQPECEPFLYDYLRIRLSCKWNWNIFLLLRKAINKKWENQSTFWSKLCMASMQVQTYSKQHK